MIYEPFLTIIKQYVLTNDFIHFYKIFPYIFTYIYINHAFWEFPMVFLWFGVPHGTPFKRLRRGRGRPCGTSRPFSRSRRRCSGAPLPSSAPSSRAPSAAPRIQASPGGETWGKRGENVGKTMGKPWEIMEHCGKIWTQCGKPW